MIKIEEKYKENNKSIYSIFWQRPTTTIRRSNALKNLKAQILSNQNPIVYTLSPNPSHLTPKP